MITFLYMLIFSVFPMMVWGVERSATLEINNEFIKVIVNKGPDDLGRFSIETTQGNPSTTADDHQLLVYGRPVPWTSYTTIHIDNKAYIFGGYSRKTERRSGMTAKYGTVVFQKKKNKTLLTVVDFGPIQVTQRLSFFRNPITKVKDTVKITYLVLNNDRVDHRVGIRVMLDTKLGSNDGAPFRIGSTEVTSELRLNKKQLSEYWLTFDSLITPNVIAQGTLSFPAESITAPDTLLLANWGTLVDNPWSVDYQKGRSFIRQGELEKDTALALYWDPVSIRAKETHVVTTLYGLGELSLSPGELSLGLTAPKEILLNQSENQPASFLVMGYAFNSGGFDAYDTTIHFDIPKGFTIMNGQKRYTVSRLNAGETVQFPIKLQLNTHARPGRYAIQLLSESATLENNRIRRDITVVAPPRLSYELEVNSLLGSGYYDVRLRLINESKHRIKNITAQLELPSGLRLIPLESDQKKITKLSKKSHHDLFWRVKSELQAVPTDAIRVSVTQLETEQLSVVINQPQYPVEWTIQPSREKIDVDDYFFIQLNVRPMGVLNDQWVVTYDKSDLKFLKLVPHPQLNPHFKVTHLPGKIRISALTSDPTFSWDHIVKLYFNALQSGTTEFAVSGPSGTFTKSVTINKIEMNQKEQNK
jgi:hypothetical protein